MKPKYKIGELVSVGGEAGIIKKSAIEYKPRVRIWYNVDFLEESSMAIIVDEEDVDPPTPIQIAQWRMYGATTR